MATSFSLKRVYDPTDASDGQRLLVDGLWPRGVRRDRFPGDAWLREVAPSADLRSWYGHDPSRFDEFSARYREELGSNPAVDQILGLDGRVTLVTATREVEISHASVLRDYLTECLEDRE